MPEEDELGRAVAACGPLAGSAEAGKRAACGYDCLPPPGGWRTSSGGALGRECGCVSWGELSAPPAVVSAPRPRWARGMVFISGGVSLRSGMARLLRQK